MLFDLRFASTERFSLALDLEGVQLSATGEICIIQLVSSRNPRYIYLLDICALGAYAFDTEISNVELIEQVCKYFFLFRFAYVIFFVMPVFNAN